MRSPRSEVEHSMNLVKVFSATKSRDRDELGTRVTAWLRDNPTIEVLSAVVSLSSDNEFHCLSIVLLCRAPATSSE